jgi:hypothetical protein
MRDQGLLQKANLPEAGWRSLGQCLHRFHNAGVHHHAALKASNVMRDAHQRQSSSTEWR